MATIHFTGTSYSGHDGATPVRFVAPGDYEVSEAKAQQLAADFPQEFTQVLEGQDTTPIKAPSRDENDEKVAEVSQDAKSEDKATEKPAKKK
jgi:hypothetical protein